MHGAAIVPYFVGEAGGGGRGGVHLKLDVQDQGGGKNVDADGQEEWRVLKIRQFSWASYVMCLSTLSIEVWYFLQIIGLVHI